MPKIAKPIADGRFALGRLPEVSLKMGRPRLSFYLPPLYASLIALSFKLFGISEISARIIGVVCFIAIQAVICLLIKEISVNKKNLLLAA